MQKQYYTTRWIYKQVNENYWIVTDNDEKEYFIFKRNRGNAFSWDQVEIKIIKLEEDGKKAEAIVSNIIRRTEEPIIGYFLRKKWQDFAFVRAYNTFAWKDIFINGNNFNWANNGDIVMVQIVSWKDKPVWKVVKYIWKESDPEIIEKIILIQNHISLTFPEKVIEEANNLRNIVEKRLENNRLDLRNEVIVTIDWDDAKDLDDAISVRILPNWYYELWVHIADVAEYVRFGGSLDSEALKRWTSIYLPWWVIPMLPEQISNNLCSLNTSWDKATLSIIVTIDSTSAKVLTTKITESIIRNKARLTYNEVWDYLTGKISPQIDANIDIATMLQNAYKLFKLINKRRMKEWKIDFNFSEVKIEVDENKKPIRVYKYDRNDAHRIIEEFMIMANEEISKFFSEKKIPFLYRIHEKPSLESMQELAKILKDYKIDLDENSVNPLIISQIVAQLQWKKEEYLLSKKILQAMTKAKYSEKILWHFWLSLRYYSHFTSPIRRYPDLQIHRIIKEYLNKNLSPDRLEKYRKNLSKVAKNTSTKEQQAEDIERKITFLKTIEYMQWHIWETFDGIVSGLNNNWLYIELEMWIEWFAWAKSIAEKYIFNQDEKIYESINMKKILNMWDKVKIKVIKADKVKWFLDFELLV